ncbi:uncharacterized protein [Battus philenor]|uniref:uncharacterized protein n=1 Tax=Battus philenor TaxID=42288 RepID=UPI0035CF45B0
MIRTPTKQTESGEMSQLGATATGKAITSPVPAIRKSLGDKDSGTIVGPKPSPRKVIQAGKTKPRVMPQKLVEQPQLDTGSGEPPKGDKPAPVDRIKEARACLNKAKLNLGMSRNLKSEIKEVVVNALDRLYQLVKEAELTKGNQTRVLTQETDAEPASKGSEEKVDRVAPPTEPSQVQHTATERELLLRLDSHARLLEANTKELQNLKESLKTVKAQENKGTYASVAAGPAKGPQLRSEPTHSVAVSSGSDTGDQVLGKIRSALNATKTGIQIDRVRKIRDGKVIIGCGSEAELKKVREGLSKAGKGLNLEEVRNRDPLVILRDVMAYNKDEDIIRAIKSQNAQILSDVPEKDQRMEVRFRRRTRNAHTVHIVMRLSPKLWSRFTTAGMLHVDLQRVRVYDHSPLVQCTRCLGYGHSKRLCTEAEDRCGHCGGCHHRTECTDRHAGKPPTCRNCHKNKAERQDHGAFDADCPVRRRWDTIARASIAYC